MAYKFREEIVGKRFLSVSGFSKLKVNKISEWGWRAGVIRAASHRDNLCQDLQVLVEYDDVEWHRREWLSPHRDNVFSFFLVEKGLSWYERADPKHTSLIAIDHHNNAANNNHHHPRINGKPLRGSQAAACTVPWPAITFFSLVSRADLPEDAKPIEFMQDRRLEFVDYSKLKPFTQDWELTKSSSSWASAVRQWAEMQDGQSILLTTPSVLCGFRVEVYRAEGTTQWYTAVIVGYNEATKDLTVTDDTVLEDHNEDPCLVQMRLIGDGVVESIMRGENVGMTPRRSRSSTALTHALIMPRTGRRSRGRPGSAAQLQTTLRSHSLVAQQIEKEKSNNVRNNRKRRISEGSTCDKTEASESVLQSRQEDRENKGPLSGKPGNRTPRTAVLEEANVTAASVVAKLRQRRVPAVKSSSPVVVETALSNRPVRRKTRLEAKILADEDSEGSEEPPAQPQHHLRVHKKDRLAGNNKSQKEQPESDKSEKEDKPKEDPLIKRLRSSLLADKVKKEQLKEEQRRARSEGAVQESARSERQSKKEAAALAKSKEEETRESRERDREPEPPPADKRLLDSGGKAASDSKPPVAVKQEPKEEEPEPTGSKKSSGDAKQPPRPNGEIREPEPKIKNEPSPQSARAEGAEQPGLRKPGDSPEPRAPAPQQEEPAAPKQKPQLEAAPSDSSSKPKELLVGPSSRDPGTVLERLSPLSAGGRSLLLQHQQEEQERSRHNESPVILVERLNKPPPPAPHHHHQPAPHHHQTLSPHHHQALHHGYHHPAAHHHPLHLRTYPVDPPHHHHHNPHVIQATLLEVREQQQRQEQQRQEQQRQEQQRQEQQRHEQERQRQAAAAAAAGDDSVEVEAAGPAAAAGIPVVPAGGPGGATGIRGAAAYGDSGSDSGVSSLRSAGSGDERSGSRSSALSAEDTTTASSSTPNSVPGTASTTPARIWHVQSVQHTSLLMAHPQAPASAAGAPGLQAPPVGYATGGGGPGPPPPHHHPGLAQEMIWRPPARFLPLPPSLPQQPSLGEVLERDRHERILRERREAEVRELESREREAKLERERIEKQRATEQAVHKHFEESLRLAQQKRNMPTASMQWNSFIPLAPPPGGARTHASMSHHPGGPPGSQQPPQVSSSAAAAAAAAAAAQQQRAEREQRDREEREHREREHQLAAQAAAERSQREQQEAANEYAAQQSLAYLRAAAVPQSAQQVSRPSSQPGKVDYPPPPAHSRASKSSSSSMPVSSRHDKQQSSSQVVHQSHQGLPKAEPNVNLFGYSSYQPGGGFVHEMKSSGGKSSSSSSSSASQHGKPGGHVDREHHHVSQRGGDSLPNPPPLLPDHASKSSVIVKNDSSREPQQHKQPVAAPAHSPSPKMMSYLNVQPVSHKSPYECRSPTQSPHGAHHHHHMQNDKSAASMMSRPSNAHHPSSLQHPGVNRHSPHGQQSSSSSSQAGGQHQVSQLPHPSPPEPRYLSRPEPQLAYPPHQAKSPYSAYGHAPHHPHQPNASPNSHYAAPAGSKPKVSSPAPSHIYGKPNSGIMTGTPVCRASDATSNSIGSSSTSSSGSSSGSSASVPLPLTSKASSNSGISSSTFQQIGHHPGPVPPGSHFAHLPPPPAHSSRSPYDSRGYGSPLGAASKLPPPPSLHSAPSIGKLPPPLHLLPPGAAMSPIARPPPGIVHPVPHHHQQSSQQLLGSGANGGNNNFQTQPLDLGVERSGSPKRKASTPLGASSVDQGSQPVSLEVTKKRRMDDATPPPSGQTQPQPLHSPQQQQSGVTTVQSSAGSPVLSRVSEPSPLIASAATSITTVVNTALLSQPNSQSQVNVPSVSPAPRTASGDGSVRPSSAGSVGSLPSTTSAAVTAPTVASSTAASPVPPSTAPSPAPSLPGTPAKADSEKSNSPAPARPPSSTSYPVHKLKKAWLQRHSGEDGTEDTTGVVGSGSCVTLPLNIPGKQTNGKDKDSNTNSTTSSSTAATTSVSSSSSSSTTTTTLPSAVNSIHNIGSMAVNSINKSKVAIKARKTPVKESVNGHSAAAAATANSESLHEDSSNSEPERKAPPKRKPPKVKRKKGAAWKQQAAVQEQRRRKKQKQGRGGAAAGSESSNESEAGSVSDSSEQRFPARAVMQIPTIDTYKASGNENKKVPKKRGRKPRTTKDIKTKEEEEEEEEDYQPRQKKKRIDSSKSSGGSNKNKKRRNNRISTMEDKPDEDKLIKTCQSWVQDEVCMRYSCTRISKCRECRLTPNQRDKMCSVRASVTVFCRFYAFRRMQYTKSGTLVMAGFNDPYIDADENDIQLWLPGKDNRLIKRDKYTEETQKDSKKDWDKGDFDIELAYQIIRQVGDQFCDLIHQEKNVVEEHLARVGPDHGEQPVIWKRVVKGVREMCDVCDTTLFNYHWTCGKCGFVVCIDCYEARKNKTVVWSESGKGRDKYAWLLCANRQTHVPEQLLLTQIIPADCLIQIDRWLHDCRTEWGIPKHCSCDQGSAKSLNEHLRSLIKGDLVSIMNGNAQQQEIKQDKQRKKEGGSSNSSETGRANGEDKNSPLSWLADVALQNQDKNDSDSDSDSDDGNHSTLRELLIRPSHKSNGGDGSRSNSPGTGSPSGTTADNAATTNTSTTTTANNQSNGAKAGKKSKMDTLNEVISSVIEHSVKKGDETEIDEKPRELKHFVRRYKCPQRGRDPLPIRIMTLTESKLLYPEVPHSWLCDGKLLRLQDPNNPKNYRIFQDQWKRGQPVLVSDVHKYLNKDLWHPDSFSKDFGDQKSDLVNCMTGNLVPKQPMWKFWEGFEHSSKRLKDEQGNAMLLKLKDWPSRGDFADILPARFADLMKCVPLSEYTHRYGRLNLTSRLPDTFTRPDLGPKMYNAYGSALYPDKGTTNLHLDVSDAVNVMVYVGISKDGDREEHIKEALKAIDEAGCDILTRRRVREKGEIPGALWHIYAARDADKIRDMLNAVALESGARLEPHHDPIHDQSFYLDGPLRERLYREYGVEGYAIVQCMGDAVFVPAGAPHQVRNLHNCIKVAEDFVSPENISHCFHLTQEFRALSDTHTNHEDKLQIKNIIYHAVKDSLTALDTVKEETLAKIKTEKSSSTTTTTSTQDSKSKVKVDKTEGS